MFVLRNRQFPAEYLKIEDLRSRLVARESPFVMDNNAGGGFGENNCSFLVAPQVSSTLDRSLLLTILFSFVHCYIIHSWRL